MTPDALIDTVRSAYFDRRDFDKREAFIRRLLAGVLIVLIVGGVAGYLKWEVDRAAGKRLNDLASLRKVYANATAGIGTAQPIAARLSEVDAAVTQYDRLSSDLLYDAEVVAARLLARNALESQIRNIFGNAYQLRPASQHRGANPPCIVLDTSEERGPKPLVAGNWRLEVDIDEISGTGKIRLFSLSENNREAFRISQDLRDPLSVPLGKSTQVCLGMDGQVLTIVRSAADGGAQQFVPEVYYLYYIKGIDEHKDATTRFELLQIAAGGTYTQNDIRSLAPNQRVPDVSVEEIRYEASSAGSGLFVVRFSRTGGGTAEAVFAPQLIRPARVKEGMPPGGVNVVAEQDKAVSVEFPARKFGGDGLPNLSVEVVLTNCFDLYRIAVSVLVREPSSMPSVPTPKPEECKRETPEGVKYGWLVSLHDSEPISEVQLIDGPDPELWMRTELGDTLVTHVALSPEALLGMVKQFVGPDNELFKNHDDMRLRSTYCRIEDCFDSSESWP